MTEGPWQGVWETPAGAASTRLLSRLDLRDLPPLGEGGRFSTNVWRACQRQHFDDPGYQKWAQLLNLGPVVHRKAWEWAAILEAAQLGDVLHPGRRAIGFGVGTEPIPACLASLGLTVLATDAPTGETADTWKSGNQHAASIAEIGHPEICPPEVFASRVTFRAVDMNDLPSDLEWGTYDLVWSSCVIEHLGSPARGFDFVKESARLLAPGGVMVHTTEYELSQQGATRDYGHMAVYRGVDFADLAGYFRSAGFEAEIDLGVSLASPDDRWISTILAPGAYSDGVVPEGYSDPAHLRLALGESITTSFVVQVRRREDESGIGKYRPEGRHRLVDAARSRLRSRGSANNAR